MIVLKVLAHIVITAIMVIVGPVAIGIWIVVNLLYFILVSGRR